MNINGRETKIFAANRKTSEIRCRYFGIDTSKIEIIKAGMGANMHVGDAFVVWKD